MNIKVGDKLKIECYKHNGYLDRTSDEAIVLDVNDKRIVVANEHTLLTEHDGKSHTTNEPAVLFFYTDKWYNIIGQLKKKGLFYYCNIATPYIIDGKTIKYIDYDLDLRVFPDGTYKVLDKNEYKYHKKIMGYSEILEKIVKKSLNELIDLKKNNEVPFKKEIIEGYYYKYLELKKTYNTY